MAHDFEHEEPAPPPGAQFPPFPLLWRGLLLAFGSMLLCRMAAGSLRASALLTPLALLLGIGALLAAWASAINLTGGARHDDHPWV